MRSPDSQVRILDEDLMNYKIQVWVGRGDERHLHFEAYGDDNSGLDSAARAYGLPGTCDMIIYGRRNGDNEPWISLWSETKSS